MYSNVLKTHLNRGIFDIKLDLSIKGRLGSKKICKICDSERNEHCRKSKIIWSPSHRGKKRENGNEIGWVRGSGHFPKWRRLYRTRSSLECRYTPVKKLLELLIYSGNFNFFPFCNRHSWLNCGPWITSWKLIVKDSRQVCVDSNISKKI